MIDILIFLAFLAVFCGGWWCGNKYGSAQTFFKEMKISVRSWLE